MPSGHLRHEQGCKNAGKQESIGGWIALERTLDLVILDNRVQSLEFSHIRH